MRDGKSEIEEDKERERGMSRYDSYISYACIYICMCVYVHTQVHVCACVYLYT